MVKCGHICFITQSFPREDALIVQRQGKSLVESGYKVSFILCDGKPDETVHGIEMKSIDTCMDGVPYLIVSKERHLRYIYVKRVKIQRLKAFLDNYPADIYQINDYEHISLGIYLKNKGCKVIFNLREYYPIYLALQQKTTIGYNIVLKHNERKFRKAAKLFDAVISCMPEMHDYIYSRMPCAIFEDVANFPVVNPSFNLSFNEYCTRENVISYFGSIYNISCQETLLKALEKLPNVRYLLAGVFYDQDYQKKLMAMPGWKQVDFLNGFKRDELPSIIGKSIVGNVVKDFAKTETPQGSFSIIKIFESMEAAIPIILPKVKLYEEMIEKYHCGICVNPYSVDDFFKAIEFIVNNKKEAYEMGQNGRKAVLNEYSWSHEYKKYLSVIQQVMSKQ